MIHVILSLIRHIRAALRPPVTSTLHTLSVPALLVPARGVRRPFRLCAMLSNHTQDQILIIALCASTHGSIHDGRSIIRVQPLPLATATMPLPSHHHRPTSAHPSIYAAQYSTPRTPTLASIIAPPLRTTLRYATLHSSHRHFASSHDHSSRSSIIFSPLPWLLYPSIAPPLWLLSSSIAPRLWLLPSIHGSS